jgi:hypothetical protein
MCLAPLNQYRQTDFMARLIPFSKMSTLSNMAIDIVFELANLVFVSLESKKPISGKQAGVAKHIPRF